MPAKQPAYLLDRASIEHALFKLEQLKESAASFRSNALCRMFDLTPRKLQWWDERRVISPKIIGHARQYSIEDAILIGVIENLRSRQVSLQRIRSLVRFLNKGVRKTNLRELPSFVVVYDDLPARRRRRHKHRHHRQNRRRRTRPADRVLFSTDPEQIMAALAEAGKGVRVVSLRSIIERIYRRGIQ